MPVDGDKAVARYYGKCPGTQHPIESGDEIEFSARVGKWTHLRCPFGSKYAGYGYAILIAAGSYNIPAT